MCHFCELLVALSHRVWLTLEKKFWSLGRSQLLLVCFVGFFCSSLTIKNSAALSRPGGFFFFLVHPITCDRRQHKVRSSRGVGTLECSEVPSQLPVVYTLYPARSTLWANLMTHFPCDLDHFGNGRFSFVLFFVCKDQYWLNFCYQLASVCVYTVQYLNIYYIGNLTSKVYESQLKMLCNTL